MDKFWVLGITAVFLLCVVITGFLIPKILLISYRCKLFDVPDERKIHKGIVPRLGGIAFVPSIFLSIAFLFGVNNLLGMRNLIPVLNEYILPMAFGVCAVLILYLVGIADDLIGVRYRAKFAVQMFCAAMLIAGGLWINNLHGVFGLECIPWWIGMPLTMLFVVFLINAINLIDGIDGLASGLCSIAMAVFGCTLFFVGDYMFATLAFATLGVLLPFFYFNVFGDAQKFHKIFMGDTGTLTVGTIISILATRLLNTPCDGYEVTPDGANMLIIVASPLLIPCFDVIRVYIGRVRSGKNPFLPDKTHIHHKLLAIGMTQRVAMISIVACSAFQSLLYIVLSIYINVNVLLLVGVAVFIAINVWISKQIKKLNLKAE
jgi:UDP-N-acetylmuramyl pentapeptide phosphotransferase/UDP-N-acetylglucosamine-1-phosphate transferase